ncbi:hypothetical protein B0H34DRAFT_727126 [Crassisporium funariophilum]|nr:hypothetical protein B0H34DRAFT_727126 [Crassisporium funariophilum]
MIVLEDGFDEKELMKSPVTSSDKTLVDIGHTICTPGIWPLFDGAFTCSILILKAALLMSRHTGLESPPTFWKSSQRLSTDCRN